MPSTPAFEPHRFRTAAAHYMDGRPPYPAALIARVAGLCQLGAADRVLDLGCGPGQLARAFAPMVGDVLAVDPEPEMLRIAAAASAAHPNVAFRRGSSYDLAPDWVTPDRVTPDRGRFRLVCMGRSFHWMDRPDTLRRLDAMVSADGAVALFGDTHPAVPDNDWHETFRAIVDRYGEGDSYHARSRAPGWVPHEGVLLDSPFSLLESVGVYERLPLAPETLVARALSMSSTSRARLGDRADAMVAELSGAFAGAALREVVLSTALVARRG